MMLQKLPPFLLKLLNVWKQQQRLIFRQPQLALAAPSFGNTVLGYTDAAGGSRLNKRNGVGGWVPPYRYFYLP